MKQLKDYPPDQPLELRVEQIGGRYPLYDANYQWYRDGKLLPGATGSTYPLTDEDYILTKRGRVLRDFECRMEADADLDSDITNLKDVVDVHVYPPKDIDPEPNWS